MTILRFNNKIDDDYKTFTRRFDALKRGFVNIIYSNCQVTVTLQLLKMTLESIETSSKSFIIVINFIAKSIRNQHLIRILRL